MPIVTAVSRSRGHTFSKRNELMIRLIAGQGVEGDAHLGTTVKSCYAARKNPDAPNLRQVHLLQEEVLDELKQAGFVVNPGALGENVTTRGLNLLTLPLGARLRLGTHAVVEVTGLREPWRQMNKFARGLAAAVLDRDAEGRRTPKAGVMTIVIRGGDVKAGDDISVELPAGAHRPLKPL